jgi:predicted kinase
LYGGGTKLKEQFLKYVKDKLGDNFVLIACGLPGTWKTETTEEIARIKNYPLLRTDLIRLEVLKNEDVFDEKVASDMNKRTAVYDEMFRQADEVLSKSDGVILDATFVTQSLRKRAAEIAARHNRTLIIQQTACPQEVSVRRILERTKEDYQSNALTEQAYLNNKKRFEAVDIDELKSLYSDLPVIHLIVDTSLDPPEDWYVTGIDKR